MAIRIKSHPQDNRLPPRSLFAHIRHAERLRVNGVEVNTCRRQVFDSASKLDALHTLRAFSWHSRTSRQRMECEELAPALSRPPNVPSLPARFAALRSLTAPASWTHSIRFAPSRGTLEPRASVWSARSLLPLLNRLMHCQ